MPVSTIDKDTTGSARTQSLKCVAKQCSDTGKIFSTHMIKGEYAHNYRQKDLDRYHPYAATEYWNISDMEYICRSSFRGGRRIEENVFEVNIIPLDSDVPGPIEGLVAACDSGGFTPDILSTSSHAAGDKGQMHFNLAIPAGRDAWDLLDLVELALYRYFESKGIVLDRSIALDKTRLIRNPYGKGLKNLKYTHEPEVKLVRRGKPQFLGDLYRILQRAGFIEQPKKPRKTSGFGSKCFPAQLEKVKNYFRSEGRIECTQRELAEEIGIPYRTLQHILARLVKDGELAVEWCGNNKAGNRRRCLFIPSISDTPLKEKRTKTTGGGALCPSLKCAGFSVLECFRGKSIEEGQRNAFTFLASLEYRHTKNSRITPEELYAFLRNSYNYEDLDTFSQDEMLKTIKSALYDRYRFPITEARLRDPAGRWSKCFTEILHA